MALRPHGLLDSDNAVSRHCFDPFGTEPWRMVSFSIIMCIDRKINTGALVGFALLFCLCGLGQPLQAQLALDPAKPYLYIELDHRGDRQTEGRSEPSLWLRLVNNSSIPVEIVTYSKDSEGKDTGITTL